MQIFYENRNTKQSRLNMIFKKVSENFLLEISF